MAEDRELWEQWVSAMKGARFLNWSKGAKDELLPDMEEKTDEQLVEESDRVKEELFIMTKEMWGEFRRFSEKKVELLEACEVCVRPGTVLTGYGDHPTDVPFLERCSTGVLVEELPSEIRGSCMYEPAAAFDASKLGALAPASA